MRVGADAQRGNRSMAHARRCGAARRVDPGAADRRFSLHRASLEDVFPRSRRRAARPSWRAAFVDACPRRRQRARRGACSPNRDARRPGAAADAPQPRVADHRGRAAGDADGDVRLLVRRRDPHRDALRGLRRPGVLLVCIGFGAATTALSVSHDLAAGSSTDSGRWTCAARCWSTVTSSPACAQPAVDLIVSPSPSRSASGRRATRPAGSRRSASSPVHARDLVACGRDRDHRPFARSRAGDRVLGQLPGIPEQRVRPDPDDAGRATGVRVQPAGDAVANAMRGLLSGAPAGPPPGTPSPGASRSSSRQWYLRGHCFDAASSG